ncbi:MAG: caspase family protein, partial [Lewinella sp.]|nr:caspase family protein [Lewinella sp.]
MWLCAKRAPRYLLFSMALVLLGSSDPAPTLRTSPHQALLFAVNNYQFMDELNYPIPNARAIAAELENHYGFQAEVVENPTFDEVDQALKRYRQAYAESDFAPEGQLLIFFSGHGIQEGANGYFMASDSDPQYPQRTALEYDYYRDLIDQINCDHILVAIDACHSATFDPHYGIRNNREFSRPGEANFDHVLANHDTYLTRCFWSSDLVGQPTPDKSDFADQLLAGLQAPTPAIGYRRSSELFAVHLELARPSPGGGRFGKDDPNGCFLFFQKTEDYIDDARSDLAAWQAAQQAGTADAYRQYIRENRRGDFIPLAEAELARLEATGHELAAWDAAKQANTPSAYQVFLATYPDSPYRDLAMHKWEASLKVALPDMV